MNRAWIMVALAVLAGCAAKPGTPRGTAGDESRVLSDQPQAWVQRGGDAVYSFVGGEIVGETRPNQPNSFLCTKQEYANFELTLEFKVDDALNSGVQIRSQARAEGTRERVFGYQVEIDPSPRRWTGGIYDEGRRGWIAPLSGQTDSMGAFRSGQWNAMRIVCEADRIRTWINGVSCADLTDAMTPKGFVALQVHGVGARAEVMEVRWRQIRIRELPGPASGASKAAG